MLNIVIQIADGEKSKIYVFGCTLVPKSFLFQWTKLLLLKVSTSILIPVTLLKEVHKTFVSETCKPRAND